LVRRGLTLSAGLVAGTVAHDFAAAAVPARLALQIVRSAAGRAAGGAAAVSPQVTALVNGALVTMTRLKKKHFVALALATLLAAGGYVAYQYVMAEPPGQAWPTALTAGEVRAEETVQLSGQVVDPDGRPREGAELYLVAYHNSPLNEGPPAA